ncbi:MAG: methylated-DNA--[protein]-cysteine S-methyltransferase [Cytophagales bacterium]|nr:methylated-DNA--[protein]-cysteine S-methyltransferase [Cytophagales bacterium]
MQSFTRYYLSPVGRLEITATAQALLSVHFADAQKKPGPGRPQTPESSPPIAHCIRELEEYFAGQRQVFSVPYALAGTSFQQKSWQALTSIPYGETITYGQQAQRLGHPKAARAVGLCNGSNPLVIVVPCHRVIGAGGKLVGYGGGLGRKQTLLAHERDVLGRRGGAAQLSLDDPV